MKNRMIKTDQYLKRIHYQGDLIPSIALLNTIQEAHLFSVPFENLDIHYRRPIKLDLPLLFRKIVIDKRGGFCYELNGLFHWLLRELGFLAALVSARAYDNDRRDYGPEFDHMAILVTLDRKSWLVDVGFGQFSLHPLPMVPDVPITDQAGSFLIEPQGADHYRVSMHSDPQQRYLPKYIFSTSERTLQDFTGMCTYHQTSPASHFTRKRVCTIATHSGRMTLSDNQLIFTEAGARREIKINGESEFLLALERYFHIRL